MKKICVVVFLIVLDLYGGVSASSWRCDLKAGITHGTYKKVGKYRVYSCDHGYVSNIPDLSKIKFKCGGDIRWKTRKVKFSSNNEFLYAQNITCEEKVQCGKPPWRQDLISQIVDQYQNKMSSSLDLRKPGYYQGDRIKFSCYEGYEDNALAAVSYDYYGMYDSETVSEITCNSTGLWNDLPSAEVPLMECTAIQCDARQYFNISNGNITNYKDMYGYFERMELSCDEGFRPKDGIESLICVSSSSFFTSDYNFGCEPITCIPPVDPVNGWVKVNGSYLGDKAFFQCDYGTKLIGQSEWTCQSDGSWDSTCVICDDEQSYCPPPCIPLGAEIISVDNTFQLSSTVEFACSGDPNINSTIRTCMRNKDWSGQPIDCTGESRFDPYVGSSILSALETTINKNNKTNALALMDVQGRSINVGDTFGVDVYFVIDVSKSIDKKKMELRNNFISALFPQLGINNEPSGTRLAFYYFASKTKKLINQHYLDAEDVFSNYTEAQQYIKFHTNLKEIQKKTKFGTSITTALEDIANDIRSKQMSASLRQAQQVVIVISDGQYNTNGDPTEMADKLKQKPYEAEIYSILVGVDEKKHYNAYQAMSNIASNIENEQHFFAVRNDHDFTEIVNNMISKGSAVELKCGKTDPYRTKLSDGNKPKYEHSAERHAWPWMAQLVGNRGKHECGGSLINNQWILTAAHCIPKSQAILLQILKRGEKDGVIRREIQPNLVTKHPQYDEVTYAYDVALIKFDLEVITSHKLLPVCLPPLTGEELAKEGVFGVVTGWGKSKASDDGPAEYLKQMQMRIKKCDNGRSDENIMFCAGDKADGKIIDTCSGDSGGPFVVRIKNDTTRFMQIGVVSHGDGCKENEQNGVYTKLTKDILTWIYGVAFKNDSST